MKKALLVRMDRIGDLILTLPVDRHSALEAFEVRWLMTDGLGFVARHAWPPRIYYQLPRKWSFGVLRELLAFLRREKFDLSIVFHAPWWVGFGLWWSRVPQRIGVKSQWHSFLFFNKSVRQKRSRAECHESEYNSGLLDAALGTGTSGLAPLQMRVAAHEEVLSRLSLQTKKYFVVHPGMGGSARNWSATSWAQLIRSLSQRDLVVVTGTPSDRAILNPVRETIGANDKVFWLDGRLTDSEWLAVLQGAIGVVAPSTGAIHAAASLGVPSVGLYCPVQVQAPLRWGPKGFNVRVLVPDVKCPGQQKCLMENCPEFDCMRKITVAHVESALSME